MNEPIELELLDPSPDFRVEIKEGSYGRYDLCVTHNGSQWIAIPIYNPDQAQEIIRHLKDFIVSYEEREHYREMTDLRNGQG